MKPKCRWECPDQWAEWSEWLAAGLHARNRWRLSVLLVGIHLVAPRRRCERRLPNHYYFLAPLGRKVNLVATQLLMLLLRTLPLR